MAKKLAVTIAGAVSLGSYEAGVLWEVLDAIRQHNEDQKTPPEDKIIIDVITGASAGGMTAVILAQKLLYGGEEFKAAYDNPLYNTWVKRISLTGLQATGINESALQSVFSSNLIATISVESVMARYDNNPPPQADPHPAVDGNLSIGLALTNLNGLAYTYPVTPGGQFTYIDYGDQMTRRIIANNCDSAIFWEQLRQAAVACGAFPIAFRTQDIVRSKQTDPDDYISPNLAWNGDPATFTYSDGGILQNQPLGMAKNLVDPIDEHVQEQRFYLFVSPHAKDPTPTVFPSSKADYFQMAKRLIGVAAGQAGFQDWITARGVNERVRRLDERADELKNVMLQGGITVDSLQSVAAQLLPLFFPHNEHFPPGATQPETLPEAQARIAKQYQTEMDDLVNLPGGQNAFRDSILTFESAAGLGARDLMTIYGITAKESELAGAGLQSFLGFFDQKYRDHDYDVGRDHAQKILTDPVLSTAGQLGPLRFTPGALRPIDHSLDGQQLHNLTPDDTKEFKRGMRRRVNEMLKESYPAMVIVDPLADLVVDMIITHVTKP
jgi:predicted acylesterase/phospholipase RssA